MLSPVEELISQKSIGKLLGPSLGDQQQGTLSIELWKNAFQSAFERLCPVRAAGHECGCLPILARTVRNLLNLCSTFFCFSSASHDKTFFLDFIHLAALSKISALVHE